MFVGNTNLEQDEDEEQFVDDSDTKPESPVSYRERKVMVRVAATCYTGRFQKQPKNNMLDDIGELIWLQISFSVV